MEVRWSPNHEDRFFLSGTNLNLYRISKVEESNYYNRDIKEKIMKTSDGTVANFLCSGIEIPYKCVAWRPDPNPDHLIAIGLNNGKVLLSSFGKGGSTDVDQLIGKELVPRHQRPCTYLEWNANETYLLTEITEKQKSDSCILVWDVRYPSPTIPSSSSSSSAPSSSSSTDRKTASSGGGHHQQQQQQQQMMMSMMMMDGMMNAPCRPIVELGPNESCSSFNWFQTNARSFICGMNLKTVRIFDIRAPTDSIRPQLNTPTRAVNMLSVDRTFEFRVVSTFENCIHIWDTRKFTDPVEVIQEKQQISRVSWCPTKSALLATTFVDSDIVKLFDFCVSTNLNDYSEKMRVERMLHPSLTLSTPSTPPPTNDDVISSFDWHPTHKFRFICTTPSGRVVDSHAFNRIPVSWSPDLNLILALDKSLQIHQGAKVSRCASTDLSIKIKRRAIRGYGTKSNILDNLPCISDDDKLKKIWTWIHAIKSENQQSTGQSAQNPPSPFDQSQQQQQQPPLQLQQQQQSTLTRTISYTKIDGGQHHQQQQPHLTLPPLHNLTLPQSPTLPQLPQFHRHQLLSQQYPQQLFSLVPLSHALLGIQSLFKPTPLKYSDAVVTWEWKLAAEAAGGGGGGGGGGGASKPRWQIFKSPLRTRAIEMCGWKFGHESPSMPIIDCLESEHQFTRSAAISIFSIRMMRAIDILKNGAQYTGGYLNMVALALTGCTVDRRGLWESMGVDVTRDLKDPYLKALFTFLTCEDACYDEILKDPLLELTDRIAFACLHLSDKKLATFLERQSNKYIEEGDPVGLVLTGLTENGIRLLSRYVDLTSDIQTAVMLILQGLPEIDLTRHATVSQWIEDYRILLDTMKLWNERAEFDVFRHKYEKSACESLRQIHISCTFCSKPIITDQKTNRIRANIKPRVQSCPHCRKPLPRCSICMLHMGTSSGIGCPKSTKSNLKLDKKLSRISEWFTWCQTCLHGGHADHMINWFKTRTRCPVSGCNCKCDQLDSVSKTNIETTITYGDDDNGGGGGSHGDDGGEDGDDDDDGGGGGRESEGLKKNAGSAKL